MASRHLPENPRSIARRLHGCAAKFAAITRASTSHWRTATFDEARALVNRLEPVPEYYLVFPAEVEPDFDLAYDLAGSV